MIASFLGRLALGLIVGAVARVLLPGPDPLGIGMTILLGLAGSFIGFFVGLFIFNRPGGFILAGLSSLLLIHPIPPPRVCRCPHRSDKIPCDAQASQAA